VKSLIRKLTSTYGPSGRETAVREIVAAEIRDHVQSIEISPMGSLHAVVNRGGKKKVMLAAQMDEIGIVISYVDQQGHARFHLMGDVDLGMLHGHGVRFPGDIVGVFGLDPGWSEGKELSAADFRIDFGADNKGSCPVHVGDFGVFERPFLDLGERLVAKGLGGRIGAVILVEVIRQISETPHELQFAFTVQEEVGRRGASTSAYMLAPEVAIAVGATAAGDSPGKGRTEVVLLGQGPAIRVWDLRMLPDRRLVRHIVDVACQTGITHQMDALPTADADDPSLRATRAGACCGRISVPVRYLHTPSEMVDYRDVDEAVRLVVELTKRTLDVTEGED